MVLGDLLRTVLLLNVVAGKRVAEVGGVQIPQDIRQCQP